MGIMNIIKSCEVHFAKSQPMVYPVVMLGVGEWVVVRYLDRK